MKTVILVLTVILFTYCKKKETTPIEPEPVCVISADEFSGKYHLNSFGYDTIEVVFLHNNCPTNKSNTYLVKGLGKAVQPMLKPNQTFEIKDYEFTVDGTTNFGTGTSFQLNRESTGSLLLNSSKISYNNVKFQKI